MSNVSCPRGGSHGWEIEQILLGEWVRWCWKCGVSEPVEVEDVEL